MAKFKCGSFRAVEAEDMREAAVIFANRIAKREFGSRGFCHHVRPDIMEVDRDGNQLNRLYEAYIGVPWQNTGCAGKNVWLTVYPD